jgi:hypothetical protein
MFPLLKERLSGVSVDSYKHFGPLGRSQAHKCCMSQIGILMTPQFSARVRPHSAHLISKHCEVPNER